VGWIIWNLFLAVIPVGLAALAARIGRALRGGGSAWLWLPLVPLLAVWLVFLPNSCYLFTEPRHFLAAVDRHSLWSRAHGNSDARDELLLRAAVGAMYTAAGALTFALSVRPLRNLARDAGAPLRFLEPLFFLVVSVGVYLGLVRRCNSWDMVTEPGHVLGAVRTMVERPHLLLPVVAFSVVLWAAFTVSDIWIDGFLARWSKSPPADDALSVSGGRGCGRVGEAARPSGP